MMETDDGKPKGTCCLEFKNEATARKSIEKVNRRKVYGRRLRLRLETEIDRPEINQEMWSILEGPRLKGGSGAEASPQLLQDLGIEGPITSTVYIANLLYKVKRKKLIEVFSLAGKVLRAEIMQDKDGKSLGKGIVTFKHPMEAVQAVYGLTSIGKGLGAGERLIAFGEMSDGDGPMGGGSGGGGGGSGSTMDGSMAGDMGGNTGMSAQIPVLNDKQS